MLPSLQNLSYRLVQRLSGVGGAADPPPSTASAPSTPSMPVIGAGPNEADDSADAPEDEAIATDTRPASSPRGSPKRQRVDAPSDAETTPAEVRSRNVGGEYLATVHAHPADALARFVESTHKYYVNNQLVPTSVTSVVHSVLPDDFNATRTVETYYDRWKAERDPRYWPIISEYVERGDDEGAKLAIANSWTAAGHEAKTLGTALHLYAELRMNQADATFGAPVAPSTIEPARPSYDPKIASEVEQFERFLQSDFAIGRGLRPYRTELTTWYAKDGKPVVAGQIDALFVDDANQFYIIDWKRVAKKKDLSARARHSTRRVEVDGGRWVYKPVMGQGPAADIAVTEHNKYSFQTSMYAVMLKQSHGIDVGDRLYLVRMHNDRADYELIHCTDFRAQAAATIDGL